MCRITGGLAAYKALDAIVTASVVLAIAFIDELVRGLANDPPILLADEKARTIFNGLRPEKVEHAIRLTDVRHEVFDGDILTHGRVVYPDRLLVDETVFNAR